MVRDAYVVDEIRVNSSVHRLKGKKHIVMEVNDTMYLILKSKR